MVAELFTGDLVNRTEESNCYGTANKGALSPDLSALQALLPSLNSTMREKKILRYEDKGGGGTLKKNENGIRAATR
jgi:hypothetical protein